MVFVVFCFLGISFNFVVVCILNGVFCFVFFGMIFFVMLISVSIDVVVVSASSS